MCAQLAVVYSEVCSLGGAGKAWFDLYGNGKKVRVMNVDIGGGTTDFSVIEYRSDKSRFEGDEAVKTNDPTARLKAKLLYKDGNQADGMWMMIKMPALGRKCYRLLGPSTAVICAAERLCGNAA